MFCVPAQTTRRLGSHRFCSSNAKLHEVLENVKSQKALTSLGVSVEEVDVSKGLVRLKVPFNPDYTQQNGFMHAGHHFLSCIHLMVFRYNYYSVGQCLWLCSICENASGFQCSFHRIQS